VKLLNPLEEALLLLDDGAVRVDQLELGHLDHQLLPLGEELVEGGSSSRMVTGYPFISRYSALKSSRLHREQLRQGRLAVLPGAGEDHLLP